MPLFPKFNIRSPKAEPATLSFKALIRWWMIGRTILVATTMSVAFFQTGLDEMFFSRLVLPLGLTILTGVVSALFYESAVNRSAREIHYFFQYTYDVFVITLLNIVTLPQDINFVLFYVISIAIAAFLSLRSGAYFTAVIASLCYLPLGLDIVRVDLSFDRAFNFQLLYDTGSHAVWNVSLMVLLFFLIALITSHISMRLRRTNWELEDIRRALRQYELDTNDILENIASGLMTISPAGKVIYANPAAPKILGIGIDTLLKTPLQELFRESSPEIASIVRQAIEEGRRVERGLVRLYRRDIEVPLVMSSSLMNEENGRLRGVSLIFEDVTHEIKARELTLRSGKLEAVTEMSAGLAHEIKNPLASIRSAVEMLRDQERKNERPDSRTEKLTTLIVNESDRLTELLRQFIQFSSNTFTGNEVVGIMPLLSRVVDSAVSHPEWRAEIKLILDGKLESIQVSGNQDGLFQVFYNLLINAAQVRGSNEEKVTEIRIACCDEWVQQTLGNRGRSAEHLRGICVADNGPGIPPGLRERIFEPFYSTRRGGFGLGLAVVNRIVHSLGGVIFVESESGNGRGTKFFIALPVARSPIDSPNRKS